MTDAAAPRRTDDETEILEKLRAYFQTKVDNLSGDEMAEGPFEDGTEFGDAWEAAAAVIDRRGGLRIRFEFADEQTAAPPPAARYPGECQNPGCTREDGVCIGYHCTVCGKPSNMMGAGHERCHQAADGGAQ